MITFIELLAECLAGFTAAAIFAGIVWVTIASFCELWLIMFELSDE